MAFHDGRDVRLFKEPEPAGDSVLLGFVEHHLQPTQLLMSHIRRATVGGNSHANTHPFMRELGGRMHEFVYGHGHRRTQADGIVAPPGLWVRHSRHSGWPRTPPATTSRSCAPFQIAQAMSPQ